MKEALKQVTQKGTLSPVLLQKHLAILLNFYKALQIIRIEQFCKEEIFLRKQMPITFLLHKV